MEAETRWPSFLQTTFSNAFSWMKSFVFWFEFHWSLFLKVQLTISQCWFRWWLGAEQATSHYLNQCWPRSLTHICGTRGDWLNNFGQLYIYRYISIFIIFLWKMHQLLNKDHVVFQTIFPITNSTQKISIIEISTGSQSPNYSWLNIHHRVKQMPTWPRLDHIHRRVIQMPTSHALVNRSNPSLTTNIENHELFQHYIDYWLSGHGFAYH